MSGVNFNDTSNKATDVASNEKTWALLTLGAAGVVTVTGGSNIASASWTTSTLTIVFTNDMPNVNYMALGRTAVPIEQPTSSNKAVGSFDLLMWTTTGATRNWTDGTVLDLVVMGV